MADLIIVGDQSWWATINRVVVPDTCGQANDAPNAILNLDLIYKENDVGAS